MSRSSGLLSAHAASGRRLLQDGEDVDLLEPQEAAADAVHVEQDDVDAADLEGSG